MQSALFRANIKPPVELVVANLESIGLERNQYWGFLKLSDEQFYKIAQRGGADKILINRN